ncbi:MAG: helix-turn-helix transcriptional regulator [Pseudobdellovibrionaceae bacterium]|nr:helix-turn-helix transcriptional regulator [Bdellovibrionales bacterium]USN47878.1 MAG: helix-turn-helix transcriptional regulator [Pseudobdellovibrionaceae bacterium]
MSDTIVNGPSYQSSYKALNDNLIQLVRTHHWLSETVHTDVAGPQWWLFFGDLSENQVCVFSQGQWLSETGPSALFLPPFSVIHWRIKPGPLEWTAFIGRTPLPESVPKNPYLMSRKGLSPISTEEDVKCFMQDFPKGRNIVYKKDPAAVSLRVKGYIDSNPGQDYPIQEIAEKLKINYRVMSRFFHDDFGLTPAAYRNNLRVMHAKCTMVFDKPSVLDVALSTGFSSSGGLSKAFRKIMDLAPSKFL